MTQLPSTFVSRVFEKTGSVLLSLHPDWRRIRRAGLIVSIGILLLLPVWIVRYPPLVDYPNHLARYFILAHLKDPNLHLAELYESKWGPYPYVALDLFGRGFAAPDADLCRRQSNLEPLSCGSAHSGILLLAAG